MSSISLKKKITSLKKSDTKFLDEDYQENN